MICAQGAARSVVNLLAAVLILGANGGFAPARSQTVGAQTDAGRQVAALLGDTSGAERYRILHNLNAANRIASGLTVADLNVIIAGMEDQRAKVISLMARKLQPNLSAADVVALLGDTHGSTRYTILHNLNAANRVAPELTVADLNAIIVGMEDQREKVISLMARKLQTNLSAADVVASGAIGGTVPTTGSPLPPCRAATPGCSRWLWLNEMAAPRGAGVCVFLSLWRHVALGESLQYRPDHRVLACLFW
jgi:hypothetical protein